MRQSWPMASKSTVFSDFGLWKCGVWANMSITDATPVIKFRLNIRKSRVSVCGFMVRDGVCEQIYTNLAVYTILLY